MLLCLESAPANSIIDGLFHGGALATLKGLSSLGLLALDWSQPPHASGYPVLVCHWYISAEDRWHSWPTSCAAHEGAAEMPV